MLPIFPLIFYCFFLRSPLRVLGFSDGNFKDGYEPSWVDEPPGVYQFMENVGGTVPCSVRGSPFPVISWFSDDGIPVVPQSGIREILPNGSLWFVPTHSHFMIGSPRVQVVKYYCHATNTLGTLVSKDVYVTIVPSTDWQLRAYDQYVLEGNTAVVNCDVTPFVRDFVSITSWIQDSKNFYPGQDLGGRIQMVTTGQLVIRNVSARDHQMALRCRAVHTITGETGETTTPIHIFVTESRRNVAPTISEIKSRVSVRTGSATSLLCPASGFPAPTITWLRQSIALDFGPTNYGGVADGIIENGPVLHLNSVTEAQTGIYTCSANNSAGVAFHQVHLEVRSALSVRVSPTTLKVPSGGSARIECSVVGSPVRSVSWLKNGMEIQTSGRSSIEEQGRALTLVGVQSNDEGIYQCKAHGEEDSALAALILTLGDSPPILLYQFIEQTMQTGSSASLKCIAKGRPTPSIRWALDGFPINKMDNLVRGQYVRMGGDVVSHVNISRVTPLEGGAYSCTASNGVGSVTHSARLNVYGPPVIRPMGNANAVAGETLVIHCPVGGYPIQALQWSRGGKSLPLNRRQKVFSNGTLEISNVQPSSDKGVYECSASSRSGETASQSVTLNVVVPPNILPFPTDHLLREGSRLTLTCTLTEGDLPLTFDWFWNGQRLEDNEEASIHKIGDFSSYFVILKVQKHQAGNYTCRVSNVAGSVSRSALINIQVPPKITPFAFRQNATTGMRLQVSCNLERGDPPVAFEWFKGDEPLQQKTAKRGGLASVTSMNLNLKIFLLDEFSSVLVIPRVTEQHSGNYTCHAVNGVRTMEFSAPLTVNVPPRWKIEPSDVTAFVGADLVLPCEASGYPPPSIGWRKEKQEAASSFEDISGGTPGIQLLSNGSLLLKDVRKTSMGKYLCEATNGIGAGLSKVVQIRVKAPPRFEENKSNLSVSIGNEAMIKCSVSGDPPIDLSWYKNGMVLQPDSLYRHESRKSGLGQSGTDTEDFELILRKVDEEDGGKYSCTANNGFGSDTREIEVYVLRPPGQPRSLHVLDKGSRYVHLAWQPPGTGNTPITKYVVRYSKVGGSNIGNFPMVSEQQLNKVIDGNSSSANISDLNPAETYWFNLIAHNVMGPSLSSEALQVTTAGEAPSGAPQNIQGEGISSSAIRITWLPPDASLSHGKIISYRVAIRKKDLDNEKYKTVADASYFLEISDLLPYTTYEFRVQAVNAHGNGPFTEQIAISTLEDTPTLPPEDMDCLSFTSKSFLVSWKEMKERQIRGILRGYKVSYLSEDEGSSLMTKTTSSNSLTLNELRPFRNYTVKVAAFTSVGDGPFSSIIRCSTEEDVPNQPPRVKGAASGPSSIIVSWKNPENPNGRITTNSITAKTSDGIVKRHTIHWPVNHLEIQLEKKQKFADVSISVSTRVGEGPTSNPIRIFLSPTVPARIMSWEAREEIDHLSDASLPCQFVGDPRPTLSWLKNGLAISHLGQSLVKAYPDGSLVIKNAQTEHSGNYTCKASNKYGQDSITYLVLVQTPPSPPTIRVTNSEKDSLTLSWSEEFNGGAPLLGVTLSYKEHFGGWKEASILPSEKVFLLSSLSCGRGYQLFATAFNKVGEGRPSKYVDAKTSGTAPLVDQRASAPISNNTHISLNFRGWRDGGCPISHFSVAFRRKDGDSWVVVSEQLERSKLVEIGELDEGITYVVRVTAHNSAGVTTKDYYVSTTSNDREFPAPNLPTSGLTSFLSDLRVILPTLASLLALISACVTISLCFRKRPPNSNSTILSERSFESSLDGSEKHKEHFYSTLKKSSSPLQKQPQSHSDILDEVNAYATIQMRKQPPTLMYQLPTKDKIGNCQFQSENPPNRYQKRLPMPIPNENSYPKFPQFIKAKEVNMEDPSYLPVESEASSDVRRVDFSARSESEEYDTFGSDSDITPIPIPNREFLYRNKIQR